MKKLKRQNNLSCKALIPIIMLIGFVPLIVYQYQYSTNLSQFDWFPNNAEDKIDFFLGWKMIAVIIVATIMLVILMYQIVKKQIKMQFDNSFYFLLFYIMFVLMSALFSKYKYWVVRGTYEVFEPVWIVLAYTIVCIYTYCYVTDEKKVQTVLKWSGIGVVITVLIGVFQKFGFDWFRGNIGKHLMTQPAYWDQLDKMDFKFENNVSYCSLYNPNFLSLYLGILIPLGICLIFACKKILYRVLLVVFEVGCIICLSGSQSSSGWMGLTIGGIISILVLLSRNRKVFVISIFALLILVCCLVVGESQTSIGEKIKTTIAGTYQMHEKYALWEVETEENDVLLNIKGNVLKLSYHVDENQTMEIMCYDEKNTQLTLKLMEEDGTEYSIDDTRFENIIIQPMWYGDDTLAITATIEGQVWGFVNKEDGYYYFNPANKLVKTNKIENAEMFNEDAFSGRGHIWNLTLPLLGKHILVGSGANTFLFEYPQDDYIFGAYASGVNVFDVKAHCWYLQQFVETGVIGTLLLIVFLCWYVVKSIKIYRRVDLKNRLSWIGFGLFSGVLVYLIVAFTNDSNVCTAPVFWGTLGLGLAVNRMLSQNDIFVVQENKEDVGEAANIEKETIPDRRNTMKKRSRKQRKAKK